MTKQFTLTEKDFEKEEDLFKILEIESEHLFKKIKCNGVEITVGMNYQELMDLLREQYRKLILVNHPDKGGTAERFRKTRKAYQELKKYIEPLASGNPCVKVSIDTERDGRLTKSEFNYMKLFPKLNIGKEAIGKNYKELISILESTDSSFKQDYEYYKKLIKDIECNSTGPLAAFLLDRTEELRKKLKEHSLKPSISLLKYITPLKTKQNLIIRDKEALKLKLIERRDNLLSNFFTTKVWILLPLALVQTIYCYSFLPAWLIASNALTGLILPLIMLNLIMIRILPELEKHYIEKYTSSQISTDEYTSKMGYVHLCYKLFVFYPLPIVFSCLLVEGFISNSFNVDIIIFGTLSLFALLITEILIPALSKGCKIYAEEHVKGLLAEDPRDRVQKETDKRHDLLWFLMPAIMLLVRKCFSEFAGELAERNLDEVNTNMSDVNKPPEQPSERNLDKVDTGISDVSNKPPEQPKALQGAAEFA